MASAEARRRCVSVEEYLRGTSDTDCGRNSDTAAHEDSSSGSSSDDDYDDDDIAVGAVAGDHKHTVDWGLNGRTAKPRNFYPQQLQTRTSTFIELIVAAAHTIDRTSHAEDLLGVKRRHSTEGAIQSSCTRPLSCLGYSWQNKRVRADSWGSKFGECQSSKRSSALAVREKLPELPKEVDMSLFKDTSRAIPITWAKGGPLQFPSSVEKLEELSHEEALLCQTLRLYPVQYLQIKECVIAATYTIPKPLKKKEMRRWFSIDVNKINKLYDWFLQLGWIPNEAEAHRRIEWLKRKRSEACST